MRMSSTKPKIFIYLSLRKLIVFVALAGFAINGFCKSLIDFSDLVIPMSDKMQLPNTYLFQTEASISKRRAENQHTNQSANSYARLESYTGALILPNGDRYLGHMKFGIPNGDGLLFFKEGNIFFGGFVNGRYDGEGAYFSAQGENYIGHFQSNQKHGNGKTFFANGAVHEGQYNTDLIEGAGIFTSRDGNKFFGDFTLGNFSSNGIFVSKNGKKFYIKKVLTTWIIDTNQPKKVSLPDTKYHLDFVKKAVSTNVAEICSKRLGITFPTDTLNEATWLEFKACITNQ